MQPNQYYLIIMPFGEVQAHLLIRCNPVTNLPTFSHSMGCNLRTRNGMFTCVCKGKFCLYSEAIILIIKCFFRSSIVCVLLTIGVKSLFFEIFILSSSFSLGFDLQTTSFTSSKFCIRASASIKTPPESLISILHLTPP